MTPPLCPTCAPKDARVVWLNGEKRGRIQHRRHCPHHDPALAALILASGLQDPEPGQKRAPGAISGPTRATSEPNPEPEISA